jgi:2-alkenal reductase
VNTAIISGSGSSAGIGFAIPVDLVNRVVPQIISHGRAPIPGIGIAAADERIAAQLGVPGVVVLGVQPGSPAAQAGMRPFDPRSGTIGDIIIAANGKETPSVADLAEVLESAGIGNEVTLEVVRGKEQRKVTVRVIDLGA